MEIIDCEHKTAPAASPDEVPYARSIGTRDLVDGRIAYQTAKAVSETTYQRWTIRGVPKQGDLILAREAPVGPVARVQPDQRVCLGQRTVLLRPDEALVDSAYLHYLLLSPEMQGVMASRAGGSTVSHLNVADIRALPIPSLPDLPMQRDIARFMTAMDHSRTGHENKTRVLDAFLLAAFSSLEKSRQGTLGDFADLRYGRALKAADRRGGDVPVFASSGLVGWHDEPLATGPGVVVGRKGNAGATYWSDRPFNVIDTAYYAVPRSADVSAEYLYFLLRSMNLPRLTMDSAVPGLNRNVALGVDVLVADSDGVGRFTDLARPVLTAMGASTAASRALATARNVFLPELISGRLSLERAHGVLEEVAS